MEPKIQRKKLIIVTFFGVGLLVVPLALVFVDPVMRYVKYMLRVDNGTMLHELMQRPFQGLKMHVYLFNVTNAESLLNGTDKKVKVVEVGPFVYQEIRTNEDIVINQEPGIMWLTAKTQVVFVPEESIGDPKDVNLTAPNLSLLYGTALIGKYPYLVQQLFNYVVSQTHSKPFRNTRVYDVFWGSGDPLINLANKLLPGIFYFKSEGILSRFYNFEYDYRLKVGTTDSDKFSVKQSVRTKPKDKRDIKTFVEKTVTLPDDVYEGEVFPQNLSPDQLISIFRPNFCRIVQFKYNKSRPMFYGGDAFVYNFQESLLNDHQNCFTSGWCPSGLMNVAPCYWDLPIVISKGHFLDADPRILELVEGLKPDRNIHDMEMIIDPKVGLYLTGTASFQVSMFLSNMAYHSQTKHLQDTLIPSMHLLMKPSPLIEEALVALNFTYRDGPRLLLIVQVCCVLLGLGLLTFAARLLYLSRLFKQNVIILNKECGSKAHKPLIIKYGENANDCQVRRK